ncbi:MAG: ribosome-associated translation inhibitor RaiA [Nitrospiraceae bacterium]|nr:ribosome-associated translation inhibitor RaiA [Nitrospiraceae bacterium]
MATLKLNLTGDGVELTDAIKSTLNDKFRRLEKYLGDNKEREVFADLIVKKERYLFSVEIVMYNVFGNNLRVKKSNSDFYTAVDMLVDAAEKQLRRLKDKVVSDGKRNHNGSFIESEIGSVSTPAIVEVEPKLYKPIALEDAVSMLLKSKREFMFFCNAHSGNACIVYKMNNGNVGFMEMPSCKY